MATVYTDNPCNFDRVQSFVITDTGAIVAKIHKKRKCFFYDTCSFRRHANLKCEEAEYILKYIKQQDGIVVITRCILMELASHSGCLNQEYIDYIMRLNQFGIDVLVIYEEDLFAVLDVCFATNTAVNSYLIWAVRMLKNPVSTITETLNQYKALKDEVLHGKNAESRDMYKRFFTAVRGNKESEDNLGEELLAICLHILSYIPGEMDGKFCVVTDDKGAAGRVDALFKRTALQYEGKRIIIFSTPKLVQVLYNEGILTDRNHIKAILGTGIEGNVVVLGTRIYDLRSKEISLRCEELTDLIMKPNGINITF